MEELPKTSMPMEKPFEMRRSVIVGKRFNGWCIRQDYTRRIMFDIEERLKCIEPTAIIASLRDVSIEAAINIEKSDYRNTA